MAAPGESRALEKAQHRLEIFRTKLQIILPVTVAKPVRGDDAGGDDGEQFVFFCEIGDAIQLVRIGRNDRRFDPEKQVGVMLPDPLQTRYCFFQAFPRPGKVPNPVMKIARGVHSAGKNKVDPLFLQGADHFLRNLKNPVGQDSIGRYRNRSQTGKAGSPKFADA
ncbi:MAG TPA: hypothetical protein VGA63_12570 [Geopsychrobacteraceae bacterium]